VPNIRSNRPAETRDFFVDLFGFEVAMDLDWVMTLASPDDPAVQITIISGDDMAAPGITPGVADVDAVHNRLCRPSASLPLCAIRGTNGAQCWSSRKRGARRENPNSAALHGKWGRPCV
jgi:hypothetical protein